ncbi:MAG TPA: hypothetical protein VF189_04820 [Patescibacteria group bacterium]
MNSPHESPERQSTRGITNFLELPIPFVWKKGKKGEKPSLKTTFGVVEGTKLLPDVTIDYSPLGWEVNDPRQKALDFIAQISSSPELVRDCVAYAAKIRPGLNLNISVDDIFSPAQNLDGFKDTSVSTITGSFLINMLGSKDAIDCISLLAGKGFDTKEVKEKRHKALDSLAAYFPIQIYLLDEVMKAFNNHEVIWGNFYTADHESTISGYLDSVFQPSRSKSAKETVKRCTKLIENLEASIKDLFSGRRAPQGLNIESLLKREFDSGLKLLKDNYLETENCPVDHLPKNSEVLFKKFGDSPRLAHKSDVDSGSIKSFTKMTFGGWRYNIVMLRGLQNGVDTFYRQSIVHCPLPNFVGRRK